MCNNGDVLSGRVLSDGSKLLSTALGIEED